VIKREALQRTKRASDGADVKSAYPTVTINASSSAAPDESALHAAARMALRQALANDVPIPGLARSGQLRTAPRGRAHLLLDGGPPPGTAAVRTGSGALRAAPAPVAVPLHVLVRVVMHVAFLVAVLAPLQIRAVEPLLGPAALLLRRSTAPRPVLIAPAPFAIIVVATFCYAPSLHGVTAPR
jgi:hypothetical protein